MRLKYIFLFVFLGASIFSIAQQKEIKLQEIWDGTFRTRGMEVLHSMNNGEQYTVLNRRAGTVDKYDYETRKKVQTIVSAADLSEINSFSSYSFSNDESKLILSTNVEPVFRRSRLGIYYVYDIASKKVTKIFDKKIQEPTFSPDGKKVAFVYKNNIYVKDLMSGTSIQITKDGVQNKIINGVTDWVYEEEFGFVRAFQWNAESNYIAFIRFDETNVPEFSMDVYGNQLYPQQHVFKYPKAGEKNSDVSLHLYNLNTGKTTAINLGNYTNFYIPRIKWTNDPAILSVQVVNRHQNELDLIMYNVATKQKSIVLKEKDKAYVDVTDNLTFLKDNSFIWTSEKDGFNHIYHYKNNGTLINQITKGPWEVTNYYGYNEKDGVIYYQSVENGSINRDIYAIKINGKKKKRLSTKEGTNNAKFSTNFKYYINTFSNTETPPEYTLHLAKNGKLVNEIKNNTKLKEKLKKYKIAKKEFFTLTTAKGNELNVWMIKPTDFDSSKKYPVFMYQYSGPGSQQVANTWNRSNDYWYQMLAQKGIIVVCVDGRGTGFKGADFKKVTYKELGKYEVEDQIDAAIELGKRPYIDKDRIGIWGWSYGGFMSSNCILKGNDVFSMAIAVAPVTSWRFYDSIYTERYMQTPQENASGYDDNSPINHVKKLKGDYLLIHGTGDDNVHVQNTMRMIDALIKANKQFDWMIYPDKNHGIYGGYTRLHLYTKMTDFITKTLLNK